MTQQGSDLTPYWDGTERRVQKAERRIAQTTPYQEYPKWVDGVLYQSEEDEAKGKGDHPKATVPATPQGPPAVALPELESPEHEIEEHRKAVERQHPFTQADAKHAKAEHDKVAPTEKLKASERRVVADEAEAERVHQANKAKTDTHKKK